MLVKIAILNLSVLRIWGNINTKSLPEKQMSVYIFAIKNGNSLKIASLIPFHDAHPDQAARQAEKSDWPSTATETVTFFSSSNRAKLPIIKSEQPATTGYNRRGRM